MVNVGADATDMTSTFDRCSFAHNIMRAEVASGGAVGGGILLRFLGHTAGGLLTSVLDSTFVGNRLAGGTGLGSSSVGGALAIEMYTTSAFTGPVQTLVDRCKLLNNVVEGGEYNQGGAILLFTDPAHPST
jgi:energy-converting hydrogenase Eha subunit B